MLYHRTEVVRESNLTGMEIETARAHDALHEAGVAAWRMSCAPLKAWR